MHLTKQIHTNHMMPFLTAVLVEMTLLCIFYWCTGACVYTTRNTSRLYPSTDTIVWGFFMVLRKHLVAQHSVRQLRCLRGVDWQKAESK